MTIPTEDAGPPDGGQPNSVPYLPPPAAPKLPSPVEPHSTSGSTVTAEMPYMPDGLRPAAQPAAEPVEFDAKAMVESQKHVVANPAYGGLPEATPESAEAARKLRGKAQRKRSRNKMVGWFVALLMLCGIGAACWFAYQAFQDDQEQSDIDRAQAQADGSSGAPGALTPLGNQQQVIEAIEDVNSGATASAGGLLGAVDDAQAAVDDINGVAPSDQAPAAGVLVLTDVRPEPIDRLGTRLEDASGYERHVVDSRQFAADSPTEYARFVALMQAQPQADPGSSAFDVLAEVQPGQIGVAVIRDGDRVIRVIVLSTDPEINVELTP